MFIFSFRTKCVACQTDQSSSNGHVHLSWHPPRRRRLETFGKNAIKELVRAFNKKTFFLGYCDLVRQQMRQLKLQDMTGFWQGTLYKVIRKCLYLLELWSRSLKSLIKSRTPKSDKVGCVRLFRGKLIFLDALAPLDLKLSVTEWVGHLFQIFSDLMGCDVVWWDLMWCDVIWCDVMWCDVMWCDVMWCDVMWCDLMWDDVMWCDVMWFQ